MRHPQKRTKQTRRKKQLHRAAVRGTEASEEAGNNEQQRGDPPRQIHFALNKKLTMSGSVQDVLNATFEAFEKGISPDAVNISTALSRMAKLAKSGRCREPNNLATDPRVQRLEYLIMHSPLHMKDI